MLAAEAELSRLLREESVSCCRRLPAQDALFINTHPREIGGEELLTSLADFRRALPDRRVVVEIHEAAVTEIDAVRGLLGELAELGCELAYDDFGAGQTRLLELAEATPAFLKFDLRLVRDLAAASAGRRRLVGGLVTMARELGIATIAEGIENEDDARACREAGFDYAQGFLYGRPTPAVEIAPA